MRCFVFVSQNRSPPKVYIRNQPTISTVHPFFSKTLVPPPRTLMKNSISRIYIFSRAARLRVSIARTQTPFTFRASRHHGNRFNVLLRKDKRWNFFHGVLTRFRYRREEEERVSFVREVVTIVRNMSSTLKHRELWRAQFRIRAIPTHSRFIFHSEILIKGDRACVRKRWGGGQEIRSEITSPSLSARALYYSLTSFHTYLLPRSLPEQ